MLVMLVKMSVKKKCLNRTSPKGAMTIYSKVFKI